MGVRRVCLLLLIFLALASFACAEGLLSADSGEASPDEETATLYFRYHNTALLAQETRVLRVPRDQSYEKTLVQALLDGPRSSGGELSGVFPPATRVLSTQAQNGVLYVTFDEGLLSGYPDEPSSLSSAYWRQEAPLRRRLAIAALTATLTESGDFSAVQVLVRGQVSVNTSVRLHSSFFLEGGDELLSAMPRREEYLMTPHNAALACLTALMQRDWETVLRYTAAQDGRPSARASEAAFDQSDALIALSVSQGSVSQDGQTAVVCADCTLLTQDGAERALEALPVRLVREHGAWKVAYDSLLFLIQHD